MDDRLLGNDCMGWIMKDCGIVDRSTEAKRATCWIPQIIRN